MTKISASLLHARWVALIALNVLVLIGAIYFVGLESGPDVAKVPATPQRVTIINGISGITLDAPTQTQMGIEITTVKKGSEPLNFRGYATVRDVQGLIDLTNSYTKAKAELDIATSKLAASQKSFKRAQALFKDRQNLSAAQLELAEATYRSDEAARASAESNASTVILTARAQWGDVIAEDIRSGSSELTNLLERRQSIIEVSVPSSIEDHRAPAQASIQVADGTNVPVRFLSDVPSIDPRTQAERYFYVASADAQLPMQINLLAYLPFGQTLDRSHIPASAVVSWGGATWIYLRTAQTRFARHLIPTDDPAPDGGYFVGDLPDKAEVVTRGAQMLLSEEFRPQTQSTNSEDED